jgi:TonB family protein
VHLRTPLATIALVLVAAVAPRLVAQDVTVTPLEWAEPVGAPDQLPVENHALRPRFPVDLRNTPDPGYALLDLITDEKGKRRSYRALATLPAYEKAVQEEVRYWQHKPGLRQGRPVIAQTVCAVIFNPASADVRKPDATPRVLAVKEVVDPARKITGQEPLSSPELVWVTVSLDEKGEPVALKDAPPLLAEPLHQTVKKWRFAPARRNGRPVAADLRVPFLVVAPAMELPEDTEPPRITLQVKPDYPMIMRWSGLRGEVLMDFVVDERGLVTDAFVARSMNPALDEPALEAVRKWRYEPGRKKGVPVKTHMHVTVMFELESEWDHGETGMQVSKRAKNADLPPEFRYDVEPKIRARVLPVYPYNLLRESRSGSALVRLIISETGKVSQAVVVKASYPEFGAAAIAMIEQWEFEPALRNGRPTRSLLSYEQKFSTYDDALLSREADDLLALEKKHPERIVGGSKLDARPKLISARPPIFPVALHGSVEKGTALVEVLVDEEGRAQLPRVVSASDPAFGWAAVQAVAAWRFEPPKLHGKAAVTSVRIPFDFVPSVEPGETKK